MLFKLFLQTSFLLEQTFLEHLATCSHYCLLVDVYSGPTVVHLRFQQGFLQIICSRQHLLLCTWQTALQQQMRRNKSQRLLVRQLIMTYSSILKYGNVMYKRIISPRFQLQTFRKRRCSGRFQRNTTLKFMSELWWVVSANSNPSRHWRKHPCCTFSCQ